jgi:hypothetical protein
MVLFRPLKKNILLTESPPALDTRACRLHDIIRSNALLKISVDPWPHYGDLNEAIEGAKLFDDCFGKYYALPVAIAILSFPDDRLRHSWTNEYVPSVRRVINALLDCDILRE